MTDLDLDKITREWLNVCGSCDAGLPMACSHPEGDYRAPMARLVEEVERLRADSLAAFLAWWQGDGCACCPPSAEPSDGTLILVNESQAWVRTDPPPGEPLRTLNGHPMGDWWRLDSIEDDGQGPFFFGEVMGLDDPPEDRQSRTFEVLYTASDIPRLVKQFIERRSGGGDRAPGSTAETAASTEGD